MLSAESMTIPRPDPRGEEPGLLKTRAPIACLPVGAPCPGANRGQEAASPPDFCNDWVYAAGSQNAASAQKTAIKKRQRGGLAARAVSTRL